MIPPLATARTTTREVQLRGVPLPTPGHGGTCRRPAPHGTAIAASVPAGAVRAPTSTHAEDWVADEGGPSGIRQGAMLWLRWKTLSGS
jgi:hypothetical protein